MTAKLYELKMEVTTAFEGNGQPLNYFSRGHHESELFLTALDVYAPAAKTNRPVTYQWWRFIPRGMSGDGSYEVAEAHSKGAFPVTAIEAG